MQFATSVSFRSHAIQWRRAGPCLTAVEDQELVQSTSIALGKDEKRLREWNVWINREAHPSTHKSFLPVRTCIGDLRELESGEAMTLSLVRRESLLEGPATCLDKWSFFVMIAAEWRTPSPRGSLCRYTRRLNTEEKA